MLAMPEFPKLLYVVVTDDGGGDRRAAASAAANAAAPRAPSFRYTRPVLQSTLQLMGCKARHAFKISRRVFEVMRSECTALESLYGEMNHNNQGSCMDLAKETSHMVQEGIDSSSILSFELYKRRTTVVVPRETFLNVVCEALSEYKYVGPNQRADLVLACRIRERKESVTVLLCGTSGCGKSTLSALLGGRLGITTVISTDSIRHMMRSFVDEKENPLLWASTYHAGECLDRVAIAEAKAKKKAKKLAGVSHSIIKEEISKGVLREKLDSQSQDVVPVTELIGKRQMAIEGYKAQSEMVIDSLDRLITAWEERKESVVVEGVHLSLNFVMGLMKKHPSIIPFMIYITNEDKHMERFAVRAKYMTLDPAKNKYVKYIRNIRTIQEYLCNQADKHLVPKVNNTNVDRSVAAIHATVFSCLRRREAGEQLFDPTTKTVSVVDEVYRKRVTNSLSSKGMFQLIQRKGSTRHLMALLNIDGSVAKAWPVESVDNSGKRASCNGSERVGSPMYGPLQIGKAEPVNLQFGNLGLSAWPSDTGGTSYTGSVDESRADGTDTGSRYFSSCCSSPRISDGPAKELKEDLSVSGSEEEANGSQDADSDEDLSDIGNNEIHDEIEGSVDEESTKSDEEYEDLALRDGLENSYWSDDDNEPNENKLVANKKLTENNTEMSMRSGSTEKYKHNMDLFLKTSEHVSEPLSLLFDGNERIIEDVRMTKRSLSDSSRLHSRSQSIPPWGNPGHYAGPPSSLGHHRCSLPWDFVECEL